MKKGWFSVVIANYNGQDYLPKCLNSVFKSTYKKFKVIVVDDCSHDTSVEIVKSFQKKHSNLVLLHNKINSGPSESRNHAIKKVDTEYVYFLDNDTEVDRNFLLEIASVFAKHPNAGGVQSLLCDFDKRDTIQNAGLKLIPQTGWAVGLQEGERVSTAPKNPTEIIGLSAALAVKAKVLKKVKFDKAFFHYSEDLDFSWRVWVAGFKIYLSPKSIVYHKVKKISERKNVGANLVVVYFHLCKNSLRSLVKNYELLNLLWYFPQCIAILLGRALLVLAVRKDTSALKGTLQAFIWFVKKFPDTISNRREVQSNRAVADSAFLSTIMVSYGPLTVYKKYFAQTKLLPLKK